MQYKHTLYIPSLSIAHLRNVRHFVRTQTTVYCVLMCEANIIGNHVFEQLKVKRIA